MKAIDIIKLWLQENGFDGLCSEDCGCGIDDFAPCSDGPFPDCESAKLKRVKKGTYIAGDYRPGDLVYMPAKHKTEV